MKVLVVSNFFPPNFIGGAEIVAYKQARHLLERGHEVRVLAGDNSVRLPGYVTHDDVFDALPVTRISLQASDFSAGGNNVAHPEVDAVFSRLVDAWRPDVVLAHHLLGLSLGILRTAAQRGIRTVLTLHDHWGFCLHSTRITSSGELCQDTSNCAQCLPHFLLDAERYPVRMRQDYIRWQLGSVDAFISPSRYLADAYLATGLPAERMHVLGNGLETARFAELAPLPGNGRLHLLFIGYMGAHKGVPVLLKALTQLPCERLHVDFVGDGWACAEYQQFLQRELPALSCRFWGRLPNERICERLGQTHVFVLPSICPENQPVTITEAMASGLPVIASRIGGIPELVAPDVTGYLTAPGDAQALAEAINRYLEQPRRIAEHGSAGRSAVAALDSERQIGHLETLLATPASPLPQSSAPIIACYGQPPAHTFTALCATLTPCPAGLPQPASQPLWLPAAWVSPTQTDILWIARTRHHATALSLIDRWLAAGKQVVVDESNLSLLPLLDHRVLTLSGDEPLALALSLLLAQQQVLHPALPRPEQKALGS